MATNKIIINNSNLLVWEVDTENMNELLGQLNKLGKKIDEEPSMTRNYARDLFSAKILNETEPFYLKYPEATLSQTGNVTVESDLVVNGNLRVKGDIYCNNLHAMDDITIHK
jgi:hypothetical protein